MEFSQLFLSNRNFVAVSICVFTTMPVVAAPTYSIVDIGPIYTFGQQETQNLVLDINDKQIVTGTNRTTNNFNLPLKAFVWDRNNGLIFLDNSPETAGAGLAISSKDVIAGHSNATNGSRHATIWRDTGSSLIPQDLGTLGGVESSATGINGSDITVGNSQDVNGDTQAFIWTQVNGMQGLGTLGSTYSHAADISNTNGWIVGESRNSTGNLRAVLWKSPGNIEDLGVLGEGGTLSWASAISDENIVIGGAETDARFCNSWVCFSVYHAFAWDETNGIVDLSFAELANTWANDINTHSLIVGGEFVYGGGNALLWENNIQHSLNDLIPGDSGWVLQEATAINSNGDIVGFGLLNDNLHAYLLIPDEGTNTTAELSVAINNESLENSIPKSIIMSAKTALPPPPATATATAKVTLFNAGPDSASNVIVKNILPEEVIFNSASTSKGECDSSGLNQRTLNCNIGELQVNEIADVQITMDAPSNGLHNVISKVAGKETDPNSVNNIAVSAIQFESDSVLACQADFDSDGDVDGLDLSLFSADFGRADCPLCNGDFDEDGDVDGLDLAIFSDELGRVDCAVK